MDRSFTNGAGCFPFPEICYEKGLSTPQPRVKYIAQPVAKEVHAQRGDGDGEAGVGSQPGQPGHQGFAPDREQIAPTGHVGRHAQAEKAQPGFIDDHCRHLEGRQRDQRANQVGHDVAAQNAPGGRAHADGRFHIAGAAQTLHFAKAKVSSAG